MFGSARAEYGVSFALGVMLPAIRFNDQPTLNAREVDDIVIDRKLAFELVSSEPLRAEDLPQAVFGRCRL